MRKLNRADIYYILNNPDNLSDKKMSKVLGFRESFLASIRKKYWNRKYRFKYSDYDKKTDIVEDSKEALEAIKNKESMKVQEVRMGLDVDALMGKKKGKDGAIIATVMTPNASELSDTARKNNVASKKKQIQSAIYKPRG